MYLLAGVLTLILAYSQMGTVYIFLGSYSIRPEWLENMLTDTRGRVEKLVKEIKESNASKKTIRHLHKFLGEKKTQVEHLKKRQIPKTAKSEKTCCRSTMSGCTASDTSLERNIVDLSLNAASG